ncbi:anaphase-promoting complex subunit [Aureococcus anophagefferens]|uniref:Anaphase-promoting complex subunit n=1 Tax=Aureococcus anophagefferens TaxID=44056 RepID=A0ABR1FPM8_AURAN
MIARDAPGHGARVGTLCWRGDALASGSRDRAICCRDVREPRSNYARSRAPPGGLRPALEPLRRLPRVRRQRQRLEGLGRAAPAAVVRGRRGAARRRGPAPAAPLRPARAARGGARRAAPLCSFGDHVAAVKAIAWSPHKRGSLASGAGTADRTIKFWDARTCALVDSVDTGSQVCALAWSRSVDELVSTHGYSLNQICIWNVPSLTNYATLTGHCRRVLYLAISPDNQTIVTGAGDETLRFWSCFPGARGPGSRAPPHAPTVLR